MNKITIEEIRGTKPYHFKTSEISFLYFINIETIPTIPINDKIIIPQKSSSLIFLLVWSCLGFFLINLKSNPGLYLGVGIIIVFSEISSEFLLKKFDSLLLHSENLGPIFGSLANIFLKINIQIPKINDWIIPSGMVFITLLNQFNILSTFIIYSHNPMRSKISSTRLV